MTESIDRRATGMGAQSATGAARGHATSVVASFASDHFKMHRKKDQTTKCTGAGVPRTRPPSSSASASASATTSCGFVDSSESSVEHWIRRAFNLHVLTTPTRSIVQATAGLAGCEVAAVSCSCCPSPPPISICVCSSGLSPVAAAASATATEIPPHGWERRHVGSLRWRRRQEQHRREQVMVAVEELVRLAFGHSCSRRAPPSSARTRRTSRYKW